MADTKTTTKSRRFTNDSDKKPIVKKPPVHTPPVHDVHKIDAEGIAVGRLATQISILLRGKDRADFEKHIDAGSSVVVSNAAKMTFSGKKLEQKKYYHHSGYPGGLKETSMSKVFEKNPGEVLKRAVWNMLPKNKLRAKMIKRLIINK